MRLVTTLPETELAETTISARFACWSSNFGRVIDEEFGSNYTTCEQSVRGELGYEVSRGRKVGRVLAGVLKQCHENGDRSTSLDSIVEQLRAIGA